MKPRLRFAHLPTPVEAMPRLTTALNGPQLWVKRDDQTGLAFGGKQNPQAGISLCWQPPRPMMPRH